VISPKADVWALGCILYKLLTFRDAFPEGDPRAIATCRFSWPDDLPVDPKLKELVDSMLMRDPLERPDVSQVLGVLAAAFPAFMDPQWAAFAPAPELTARARPRPVSRRSAEGAGKRRALDLTGMIDFAADSPDASGKGRELKAENDPEAPAHPVRVSLPWGPSGK
jgi:serine/threonine protein kinase